MARKTKSRKPNRAVKDLPPRKAASKVRGGFKSTDGNTVGGR